MLRRASPRVPFEHFTTLDLALEYCENRALAAARSDGAQADGAHLGLGLGLGLGEPKP